MTQQDRAEGRDKSVVQCYSRLKCGDVRSLRLLPVRLKFGLMRELFVVKAVMS